MVPVAYDAIETRWSGSEIWDACLNEICGSAHGGQADGGIRVRQAGQQDLMQGAQVLPQGRRQVLGQLCKHEQGPLHQPRISALCAVEQEWQQLWPSWGLEDCHGKLCHRVTDLHAARPTSINTVLQGYA